MPAPIVHNGALVMCSFGLAPATLIVPSPTVVAQGTPAADITCCGPANIPTFGMCTSLSNPTVASATAAALGVLTPMPCVPVLTPWKPGSPTVQIGGKPALTATCTSQCAYGGVIQVNFAGTTTVNVA
ncbi:MAG TPA: DUF4280 domain-containing protein [Jatrophihabitans sp.]|jgi:hypothetical protein